MKTNKIIALTFALFLLIGTIHFMFLKGVYVKITNKTQKNISHIQVSCRGFKTIINLAPAETKKVKLNFSGSGDNSLTILHTFKGKTLKENFGYFEGYPYEGTFEFDYTEDGITLIEEDITLNLL